MIFLNKRATMLIDSVAFVHRLDCQYKSNANNKAKPYRSKKKKIVIKLIFLNLIFIKLVS